ncbi:helix-turn-helix transcriptional regulator [Sphingomonas sp. 36D10-4-7]|uniref:Helix-turn-helix transcriptional regulator n=2 Tax=Sphingomonas corticis TaxID=2722791 RepID=A0ABX1CTK9_9SPHN|nr:helix-turn-helix transcriptional regulator [Sphingomonas corticis]
MQHVVRSSRTMGDAIRRSRRMAGMTQAQLATRTNLRQATISHLENGEGGTLETLFAVITALRLELHLTERSTSLPALDDLF